MMIRPFLGTGVICFALALGISAQAEVRGYFTFDDISGSTFRDASGHGLLGTLGAPAGAGAPEIVTGPSGDASDRAIEIPVSEGMVVDDSTYLILDIVSPMTLQAWVRSSGFPITGDGVGIIAYGGGTGGYRLGLTSAGNIAYIMPGVATFDSGVAFPFDDEWHHVAVVNDFDGATVTLYLDGEEIFSAPNVQDNAAGSQKALFIGRIGTTPNWIAFEGAIDRVWVINEALTADELDSDPQTVKPIAGESIAFYNFDSGTLPFQGDGVYELTEMVTLQDFTTGNASAPQVVEDSPSGAVGDTSLYFENRAFAVVHDPNKVLDVSAGDDFTLEAWVKYAANNTTGRQVLYYYGPGGYSFSLNGGNPRSIFVTTLRIADLPSTNAPVPPDDWHHIALVHREGESLTFLVDGVEREVQPYDRGANPTELGRLTIGSEPNGALPFTGWIDRVRISDTALTADELDSDPQQPTRVNEWSLF